MASANSASKNRIILGREYITTSTKKYADYITTLVMTFGPDKAAGARVTKLSDFEQCLDYFQSRSYNEVDTGECRYISKS
jgi:hypothetical protein